MQVKISDIHVDDRVRQDAGELSDLVYSIQSIGLIHPILISESRELLSGFRRLSACKQLGWETIEARIVTVENDGLAKLEYEYHENIGRRSLDETDIARYHQKKAALLKPDRPAGLWGNLLSAWRRIRDFIKKIFSKK